MCESCDKWVRERRDPFWTPKKLKTSLSYPLAQRYLPPWRLALLKKSEEARRERTFGSREAGNRG